MFDLDDEEQIEAVETIAKVMYEDDSHLFKIAKMQQQQGGGGGPQGQGGGRDPSLLLSHLVKAHNILYPIATHHLLEDLDTMWNLWYTHKLPLKWWLEDRSTPCSDLIEKDTHNSKEWKKKKMNYFQRLPHQMHVEIFCKDYEYERYLVRTNRGKYSKRRANVAVIIVRVIFISSFFFYCLLLNHSFQTNPNSSTNYFELFSFFSVVQTIYI